VWVDGKLGDEHDALVSPFDHGLLTGDGVFETLRVYRGTPFAWTRHLARLHHSADGLGLTVLPADVLRDATDAVLTANHLADARVRITVTGGAAPLGSDRPGATPCTIVAATALAPVDPTVDVVACPWPRNERGALAGLKTISYGENVRALAFANARGAGEALFANTRGDLCEGTGTNVFVVLDGRVLTPPASAGCLLGVTRALVLELCTEVGVAASETDLAVGALAAADEMFLTGTTREVQPIARLDGRTLPLAPGPVTARLAGAFRDLVAREKDP
jgi:branched-chain amino acid aminotransferase